MGRKAQKAAQRAAIHPDEIRFGKINGVFGLAGEVRLYLYNRETEIFSGDGTPVVLVSPDGDRRESHIRSRPGAGKRVLGKVRGVSNPEQAHALIDWEIVVDQGVLPSLDSGEFYHHQLLGLAVHTDDGELVGNLHEIHPGVDADVWVVETPGGPVFLLAIRAVILQVDLDAGIVVDGAALTDEEVEP